MAVYRHIYTSFWQDARVVEEMTPEDRYFYLYLLTNPNTTQIGIYPLTKKQMAFDTGYAQESVKVLLDRFENHHELIEYNEQTREIAILNWGKYNFIRGGKPVEDCVKRELREVKDKELIRLVAMKIENPAIRKIYEAYYLNEETYMSPSKLSKPQLEKITAKEYVTWRDKQTCFYTGKVLQVKDIEVDHITPESDGGTGTPDNLVVSWEKFNQLKSGDTDLERVCRKWNNDHPHDPVDYQLIVKKIATLKAFEKERWISGITYRTTIEKEIRDMDTLRKFTDTIRGQKEEEEKEEEKEQDKKNSRRLKYDDASPYMKMAVYFRDKILNWKPNAKVPKDLNSWADTFRLIHEKDDRSTLAIAEVIKWATSNSFWQPNILSAKKLREKFDTLEGQMKNEREKIVPIKQGRKQATPDDLPRAVREQMEQDKQPVAEKTLEQLAEEEASKKRIQEMLRQMSERHPTREGEVRANSTGANPRIVYQ